MSHCERHLISTICIIYDVTGNAKILATTLHIAQPRLSCVLVMISALYSALNVAYVYN